MKRKGVVVLISVFALALLLALIRPAGLKAEENAKPGQQGLSFALGSAIPRQVQVAKPRRGPIAATIEAPGTIRAGSETGVGARFEGTVLEICKDVGDQVAEGDVLFRLDPTDKQEEVDQAQIDLQRSQAALAEAAADLQESQRLFDEQKREPSEVTEARLRARQSELSSERAAAQLQSATTKLERAQNMQDEGIGREMDVETAQDEERVAKISARIAEEELRLARETLAFRVRSWEQQQAEASKNLAVAQVHRDKAKADLHGSQLKLEQARRDLEHCDVKTGLAGVVTGRGINQGELVSRMGENAHYIVSDLEHLLVYAKVDEGDVVRVKRGQPARVRVNALGDERSLRGAVYDVGYRADETAETATFQVRVLLEPGQTDHERLRPGMSASVEVTVAESDDALKLPLQAVLQREVQELPEALRSDPRLEGKEPTDLVDVVYAAVDGQAKVRLPELGIHDDDEAEVLDGVGPEESLVVGPFRALEDLRDGRPLHAEEAKDLLPEDVAAVDSAGSG